MRSNPLHTIRDRRRSDEGFTLIELLVVVVILGILIGIAIPVYLNYRKSANDKAAQSDLRNAVSTIEVCSSDTGTYPASTTAGTTPTCTGQTITKSAGVKFSYYANSTQSAYIMTSTADGGSGKIYCYASTSGGSVKTTAGAILAYADTCPA